MHTVLLQMIAEGMEIAAIFVRHIKSQESSLQGPSSPQTAGGVVGVQLVSGMPHLETFATTPEICKYISGDFQGAKVQSSKPSTPDGGGGGSGGA